MLLVDVTVVQVALPTIQRDLHSGFTDLEWVIDAYALSLASVILTCGALADRYGRKRVFIVGVVVFTGGVVCVRAGTDDGRPDLVACPPGSGRWCDVRHQLGADRADLPGP